MSRPAAIWLGFAVLVVHNVEEWLTMGAFLDAHRAGLPAFLQRLTGARFEVSLTLVTLLFLAVTWKAASSRPRKPWLVLAIALDAAMGVNGVQHAAIAAWAGGYAPGVITGLFLVLPYAVYVVRRALREEWVGGKTLACTAAAAVVLTPPFLFLVHALSMRLL